MIPELSKEELQQLTVIELASRMDAILEENEIERYGLEAFQFKKDMPGRPSVTRILQTNHVAKMDTDKQRTLCYLAFNTLLQMEYSNVASAASNTIVYSRNYSEESWKSVKTQVNNSALNQFQIISSRISMECFMELVHFLGEGERIRAKKSTFKSFKKWLNNPENPFSYFATHILRAFVFDRNHRSPEVHGSSKLHGNVLQMKTPNFNDKNKLLQLTNVMLNVWQPLLDILNDGKAYSIQGGEDDFKWLKAYTSGDDQEKERFLKNIFDQMQ
ncbi:hypothetical protein M0357_001576 [Vibrio harveyi]|uniref:hypothetical protein n=1 Tax=Vibrio harveyi TaxID=669 RepID=UPI00155861B2|nr:hypothetical protein [Vibrio harveyi]EKO3846483.1 hypothetical protein [Vibrio harveyi]HDM8148276.1 hypothetical protein [Vibrio harveyi]HDM8193805.1 hypothetical protein [Vibrio harveyi]